MSTARGEALVFILESLDDDYWFADTPDGLDLEVRQALHVLGISDEEIDEVTS
ncbi:hypothetical protein [Pseudonocardia pini]|uniref:hypothetical protein n=1 Tax=Pseudonocardia pini TaxID=2758030 RepID=UPI0015F0638A|nr:hypothetical protein [Pseudonocardia pini]